MYISYTVGKIRWYAIRRAKNYCLTKNQCSTDWSQKVSKKSSNVRKKKFRIFFQNDLISRAPLLRPSNSNFHFFCLPTFTKKWHFEKYFTKGSCFEFSWPKKTYILDKSWFLTFFTVFEFFSLFLVIFGIFGDFFGHFWSFWVIL